MKTEENKKILLISLGCAKNLVNSEQMLFLLRQSGYEICTEPEEADIAVVNTCGFIDSAKSEAIETILDLAELKKEGILRRIVVTGCMAERYGEEIRREIPEVDALVGVGSFDEIVQAVHLADEGENPMLFGDKNGPLSETERIITTPNGYAYLKIADGCDNRCSYCAIPDIRGVFRSRGMENILQEAEKMAAGGIKEIIIVAQDITRYGVDIYGRRALPELLKKLCGIPGVEWLRLHYLYPDGVTEELIDAVASEDKILKYLDIPIQHINDGILTRMNRRGTGAEIRAMLKKLRERIPSLVLRTSIITGLPGEGEAEFQELCDFLRESKLERVGVFAYSPEEGTPASSMDRPDEETALRRADIVMGIQSEILDGWSMDQIGKRLQVICEGYDDERGLSFGRSFADSPDIDGRLFFSGECAPGKFYTVLIEGCEDGDLYGKSL